MMAQDEKAKTPAKKDRSQLLMSLMLAMGIALLVNQFFMVRESMEQIPYSQFLQWVDQGKVSEVLIGDTQILGKLQDQGAAKKSFMTIPVKDDNLVSRLQAKGVTFTGVTTSIFSSIFSWLIPALIFYFIFSLFLRRTSSLGRGGVFGMAKSRAKIYVEKGVTTTFADVAGIDEAKEELKEIVSFLRDPEKYKRMGGRAPKGILLVGPPGTGKTLLARALAGEAKVPFFSINGSEFVEMFVGLGAARVRELFQDARNQAPCLVFIDEIDALGQARIYGMAASGANDEKEQTLHQLLVEMDGFDTSQGVILIAATNRPQILDPALLRAGRFDRQVLVDYPDQAGRVQILQVHSRNIKVEPSVSLETVASLTAGFSGADLANLVNEAALLAVRRGAESVTQSDLTAAVERVVAGLEHKKRLINVEEKRRVAYHEMGHATVALNYKVPDRIHKVSIIPRGLGALGYTMQRPIEDRYLVDADELMAKIAVLLGGRASEKFFFQTVSTGAADDLVKATEIARAMVTQYAMSDKLGSVTYEQKRSSYLPGDMQTTPLTTVSEKTAQSIDEETKRILDHGLEMALWAVNRNKEFIEEAVSHLLEKETLDEQEVQSLWETKANRSQVRPLTMHF